jgi:tripartite-type tricarboxylate transporter receptor subunit TctC
MISRRHLLISSLGAACAAPLPALAQAWPARPVTMIVPFAAGGTTDIIARVVGDLLGQQLGQSFIVENRGGAGGAIGSDAVVRAAPDGYTLLHATAGTLTYNPHIVRKPGQGPQNPLAVLTPIGLTFACDFVVIVRKGFPAETLQDFITHAKARPGDVTFGSGGLGSGAHVCTELFMAQTGTRMRHVTYRGSGPALNDLAAGQIDVIFDAMPSALGQIQGGTVRILATTGPQRSAILPAVPTVRESGLQDYAVTAWGGLLGPKGISAEVVQAVSGGLAAILTRKDVMDRFLQIGAEAITETPEQMTGRIEAEFSLWGKIIDEAKIRTQ